MYFICYYAYWKSKCQIIVHSLFYRQVALKALNERLVKAEGQSNWPSLIDEEEKSESKGKIEEKKEEVKLPIPDFKENSTEGWELKYVL